MKRLFAISTLLILTACAAPITATPTPSATTIPPAIPSDTPPPTATPTNTATLTESPTPITFLHTLDTTQDYFFNQSVDDCVLPCWEGLYMGISHADDVEAVLNNVFEVSLADGRKLEHDSWGLTEIIHSWEILDLDDPSYGTGDFQIHATFDQEYEILQGIHLILAHRPFNEFVNPRQVIIELGQPDYIFYGMTQTIKKVLGISRLVMIYDEGISFYFNSMNPLTLQSQDAGSSRYSVEYCIGSRLINDDEYAIKAASVDLFPPLVNGLENMSPIQDWFITQWIEVDYERNEEKFTGFGLIPIEDYFGLTISQVSDLLLQDDDACLYAEYIDD